MRGGFGTLMAHAEGRASKIDRSGRVASGRGESLLVAQRAGHISGPARSLDAAAGAHAEGACLGRRAHSVGAHSVGSGPSGRSTSAAGRAQSRHKRSGSEKRKSHWPCEEV